MKIFRSLLIPGICCLSLSGAFAAPEDLNLSTTAVARSANVGDVVALMTTVDPSPGATFSYQLVTGDGSADNGFFEITGDQIQLDRSLNALPNGRGLELRIRTTDQGNNMFEKRFVLQLVDDSDNDGLDDAFELTYFTDLATASGTDDNDNDTLNNLAEQARGTDPTKPDTDGDHLMDGLEDNSGIFQSPASPGTNPLIADTDGDGILDGDEVSGGNGSVTDPTLSDSDNDGFNDRIEIENDTDPNDGAKFPAGLLPIQINELVAANETGLRDGDDKTEDWIELFNPNPQGINLEGYHLTDDQENLKKWSFPTKTIPPNGYLLIFASGNNITDSGGNLHTNFRLTANGEFLALVQPDGVRIDDQFNPTYPEQFTDVSYGRKSGADGFLFFENPTPRRANSTSASPGVVKDTNFDKDRGFYDDPFMLRITSDTRGATIRYTTDGSPPSLTNGDTYNSPIEISRTTNVRAIAYFEKDNFLPTNIDTHTYLFVEDVETQNKADLVAKGWPDDWGYDDDNRVRQTVPADYDMDPRVVNDVANLRQPGYEIRDALLDIPSVSVTMTREDFLAKREGRSSSPRSLYGTPRQRFEKICSVEYLLPDGSKGFQEDCKIETHGNSSRSPARMQKHSLRLTFSSEVGVGKLRYDLFPDSPVDEFNKLVLRACFTDSWALASWSSARYRPNDSLYTRDVWMKDSFQEMGQPSSYGNFVHLYVNGVYFGLHNLTERIEDDFYAEHLGGETEDWEVNSDLTNPGPLWASMLSTLRGAIDTPEVYEIAKTKIDVENYADWVILHLFADSEDWPNKNGYAAANAISGDGRYRFNVWDQEIALDKYTWNRYDSSGNGMQPFQRLRRNEDFRMLFADRVYKHMFDGGALTVDNSSDRLLDIHSEIDKAIVAESARWGDVQESTPYGNIPGSSTNPDSDNFPPLINNPIYFTREQHWVVETENVINNYLPTIHDQSNSRSFLNELRREDLYPDVDPPEFSQEGGVVPQNFALQLNVSDGAVYYTTDGSDPRLSGGAPNPAAGTFGGLLESEIIAADGFGWTYLSSEVAQSDSNVVVGNASYNMNDWKHPAFDDSGWAPDPVEFPNGAQGGLAGINLGSVNGFEANTQVDIGPFTGRYPTLYFRNNFTVDDPTEIVEMTFEAIRDDSMIIYLNGREVYRDDFGKQVVGYSDFGPKNDESETVTVTYELSPGELVAGNNTIAVEVHNESGRSSDLGLQLRLLARIPAPGGNTLNLTQTGKVKARVLKDGEWSALRSFEFIVGTPAAAGSLVISEIMYHPQTSEDDLEYLELLNLNPSEALDLTNVTFTDGIGYTFPAGVVLPPLGRIAIAEDREAFLAAYPGIIPAPGSFENSLSNGGENLTLIASDGTTIQSFSYDDDPDKGWPVETDGGGPSLVLVDPLSNPDPALSASWRASDRVGGSPGKSDVLPPENPGEDSDEDGLNVLAEFFFGTSDSSPNLNPVTIEEVSGSLAVSFTRILFADNIDWQIQGSNDLQTWTETSLNLRDASLRPNGTLRESYSIPINGEANQFYRLFIKP